MIINREYWSLVFVAPDSSILQNDDGTYTLGCTVPQWKTIYVTNDIKGRLLKNVLAHEIAHAEFHSRGIVLPIVYEEILCNIIADNISDVENLTNKLCCILNKC